MNNYSLFYEDFAGDFYVVDIQAWSGMGAQQFVKENYSCKRICKVIRYPKRKIEEWEKSDDFYD